ncbi:hypothetical protein L6452_14659 [Arctium lappa]|uniref:Uncharacterized protein n=1 Tax=Arctium lappa TaxID=4217 RepID=A0ACB9CLN4_ARCLA|nr:hypothetical protein L6452_14659 [Arctium lappa]
MLKYRSAFSPSLIFFARIELASKAGEVSHGEANKIVLLPWGGGSGALKSAIVFELNWQWLFSPYLSGQGELQKTTLEKDVWFI